MPIGDRAREEIIVSSETKQIFRRACVNISGNSLKGITFDNCLGNPNIRFTNGHYELIYRPISKQRDHARINPFIVRCDMLPGSKIRVKNWEDLKKLSKDNLVLQWLINWTTIDKTLFNMAKMNYFVPIIFTIKYTDYINHLQKLEPEARMQLTREEWMIGEKYRAERLASR